MTANAGKLIPIKNEEHLVGYQKDIDINKPEQLENIFYEPNLLLQSVIEKVCIQSKQKKKIVRLSILDTIIYFDAVDQKVYSTEDPKIIQSLCLTPHNNGVACYVKNLSFRSKLYEILETEKDKTLAEQSWDMENFVWLVALWSSRGRITKETSLSTPVALMQWPNLTRLASIPHAVRIAALLYEAPYSLVKTAQLLGIEQRYVFAFYSACKSIGLAKMSQRKVERPVVHKHYENPSLLKKILGKLLNLSR